jgi:ABC-type lipoprotein release transport system permease subunit
LLYVGVIANGFIGCIIARLQPRGLARALFGAALAQALVGAIASTRPPVQLRANRALAWVCVALFAGAAMSGLLFGLWPSDPITFVAVPLLWALVVVAATWLPARRAVRLEPMSALRSD